MNTVKIKVEADNDSKKTWSDLRADAKKFGDDIKKFGKEAGDDLKQGLSKALGPDLVSTVSRVPPILYAGVAAAAPLMGSLVSAALIGGASVGAAGIGVALVAQNDLVKNAATNLGNEIKAGLQHASEGFIDPVLHQIGKIGDAFEAEQPKIKHIFDNSSGFLDPLVDGAINGVSRILDGIDQLVENGGPVVEQLGDTFTEVGDSIGDAMETIAGGGEGAARGLKALTDEITMVIDLTGPLVRGLTEIYEWMDKIGVNTALLGPIGQFYDMAKAIGIVGDSTDETKGKTDAYGDTLDRTTDATKDQISATEALADEMRAQADPLFALIKGQRDVAKAQKDHNEAVRKYGPNSAQAKDSMVRLAEAAFRLNGAAAKAAGGFNGTLTPAMKTALRNAGVTAGQMKALERQLEAAAGAAHDWEGTFKQTYIVTRISRTNNAGDEAQHGGRASGGTAGATPSGLTWVGEFGPELAKLPIGTSVSSAGDSRRMAQSMGGFGGGGSLDIEVSPKRGASRDLIGLLIESLQYECRTRYQSSAQTMLGGA